VGVSVISLETSPPAIRAELTVGFLGCPILRCACLRKDCHGIRAVSRPVAQVTAAAWAPLAGLRTLSLTLPRSLSRDTADDVLRACAALRTLRLHFPAGSVDTAYLARHAERCGSLQLLEVTAQRMLFTKTLDSSAGSSSTGAGTAVLTADKGV